MQVGIDSFAAAFDENGRAVNPADRVRQLVEQIEHADEVGLDAFGVGEHHRREFLDSAPAVILGAAAARTQRIRLTSAVTGLSAEDPVRAFQNFATLDLLSHGRAEVIVGCGSSIEAFPLFGFRLEDYDSLFAEKLDLLTIREHEHVHWSSKHRDSKHRDSKHRAACAEQGKGVLCGARFPDCHHLAGRSPALAPALIKARSSRNQVAVITPPSRSAPLATLLQRVREQYRDTPGLTLTKPQATRLFGVAPSVCAAMLSALVRESFLSRRGEGLFVRATPY